MRQQRYALVGEVCPSCEQRIFPPRDLCPDCGEEARELYQFSGRGEVYSFTTVYQAPAGFEQEAPYPMAMVRLEEGPLVTAQLTDLGDRAVQIGMPVEMVTRKLRADGERGMLVYGYKFRPLLNGNS
ncbi:MAG TPA: Zn-ribbon domain-containing OB-fold protein [Anaerolineales bacterium]